jgi:sodium-dependent dicarboxylate transporter 2/3/5
MRERIGFWAGLAGFCLLLLLPAPEGMTAGAWRVTALAFLMACWWMTEALPLTATALLPFTLLPLLGISTPGEVAGSYYSPTMFLVLGGAFIALAIERTGLHRRLALAIVGRSPSSPRALLLAFMIATGLLSMIVSNTAATLIMMPVALAILAATDSAEGEQTPLAIAMTLGVAYAGSIGGLGTLVGSPTNAVSAGLIDRLTGFRIDFLTWAMFGVPMAVLGIPLAWAIIIRTAKLQHRKLDQQALTAAIGTPGPWTSAEKRLVPIVALVVSAWVVVPLIGHLIPKERIDDGIIAIAGALLLFVVPGGDGRPLLRWREANAAPWDVIMMFGGGLALAEAITRAGLAIWLGERLETLNGVSLVLIALVLTALIVLVTEFASNVASASGFMPVVAGLIIATGADPLLLAMPTAIAASWGFMLPAGTGPNAIAFATGRLRVTDMLRAGFWLDLAGIGLIVAIVFLIAAVAA